MTTSPPTLAARVLAADYHTTNVLMGYIASHFASADTLDADTLGRYLDESLAVS